MSKQLSKYVAKDIEGYEGRYSVTRCGKVYSHSRVDSRGVLHKGRWLKPYLPVDGYAQVKLALDGVTKTTSIHRVVADAFLPNPNKFGVINHKDEDKHNPHVDNLERCTSQYNSEYSLAVSCSFISPKGEQVDVTNLAAFCRKEGLDPSNISKLRTGKQQVHKGWRLL